MSFPMKPSITSYGAVVKLKDAFSRRSPETEWSADEINQARNDLTGVAIVAPICRLQIKGVASGNPLISASPTWTGMALGWASGATTVFVRTGVGQLSVALPATVQDFLGNTGVPVNITDVAVRVLGNLLGGFEVDITGSNTFNVFLYDTTFSPSDYTGDYITFTIY